MKRQQITEGAILQISLPCEKFGYARILAHGNYAFYNFTSTESMEDLDEIIQKPVLFIVGVHKSAVNSGRWVKIGKKELEDNLKKLPFTFMAGPGPSDFRLYNPNTGEIKPSTKEECRGLEATASWEAHHVEDRLCDYYAGKPNKWLEQLRIKD